MSEIQRNNQTQMQVAEVPPQYINGARGSVGTSAWVDVAFDGATRQVLVDNTHATNDLLVRFRKAANQWGEYKTIAAGGVITFNLRVEEMQVKGGGAATTYEILYSLE